MYFRRVAKPQMHVTHRGARMCVGRCVGTNRRRHTEYLQQDVRTWTLPCAALIVPVSTWDRSEGFVTTSEKSIHLWFLSAGISAVECGKIRHLKTHMTSWRTGTNGREAHTRRGAVVVTRDTMDNKKRYSKVGNMFRATLDNYEVADTCKTGCVIRTPIEQHLSRRRCTGWETKNSTSYLQWESERGKSKQMPDGVKNEPWSYTRREKATHSV